MNRLKVIFGILSFGSLLFSAPIYGFEDQPHRVCTGHQSSCLNVLVDAVNKAKVSIIYPPSWLNSTKLTRALMRAKERGVLTELLKSDHLVARTGLDEGIDVAPTYGRHHLVLNDTVGVVDREKVLMSYPVKRMPQAVYQAHFSVVQIDDPNLAGKLLKQVLDKKRWLRVSQPPASTCRLVIPQRMNGNYEFYGDLNGHRVRYLVDTGATYVTVPAMYAKKLGLKPRLQSHAQTATHKIVAHITWIDEIKLGPIVLRNVKAALIPNSNNRKILLGMSALRNLDMLQTDRKMVLLQYKKKASTQPCVVDAAALIGR